MSENPSPTPPPWVAIVDDDDSVRNSARMLVQSFGFRAEAFARAEDFLKWPLLDETSCLILDVLMPGITGLELQRLLKWTRPRLPIIFITAHAKEHEEKQAINTGAVAVLRKPVTEILLLNTLRAALSRPTSS
ncbi:MAG: putative two component response regulator [Verrucomicrobia bacterium]|nr:putative two component response regulator [Verrucomicrobiota bacterium]